MTNEEAAKILRRIQEPEAWEPQINGAAFEALDMAIEALGRQQAAGSKNLISRSSLLAKYDEQHEGPPGRARKLIEDEPSALGTNLAEVGTNCSEFPNSSDTISRQAAIDALDKRFDNIPMEQTTEILQLRKDLRQLPSAQPTFDARDTQYNLPIGTDLISRADAIEAVQNRHMMLSKEKVLLINDIENLPPAQPELIEKTAYIRGFEQGRAQGMIDSQGGRK